MTCVAKQYTIDDFKKKLYKAVKNEYSIIGDYKGANKYTLFIHNKCGEKFVTTPDNFMYKNCRCKKCRNDRKAKSPDEFRKEFEKIGGSEYKQLSPYIRSHSKIKVKHTKCGTTYMVTPKDFLKGERCPVCNGNIKKSTEEFRKEVYTLTDGEYILVSRYKNNYTQVSIKHKKCGHTYKVRPHDFLSGNRCPYCRESKGEKLVEKFLCENKIEYEQQKCFPKCSTGLKNSFLRFDFYLPGYNALIEYDGIQHFKPIEWFGGTKSLKRQEYRDSLKNSYASKNKITLLRIPYTLTDRESIKEIKYLLTYCKAEKPMPKSRFMI